MYRLNSLNADIQLIADGACDVLKMYPGGFRVVDQLGVRNLQLDGVNQELGVAMRLAPNKIPDRVANLTPNF